MQRKILQKPDMPQEKSYYDMRCEFYEKFKTKIRPKILPFEKERINKKRLSLLLFTLFLCLGVLLIGINLVFAGFSQEIFVIGILFFLCAVFVKDIVAKGFERKIKTKIMANVCPCFGNLYWGSGSYKGDAAPLDASCVVPRYDFSSFDDIFIGEHKNVHFEIIEAEYTREDGSGKSRRTVAVFDGVILKVKMNKNFNGHTVIKPDEFFHPKPAGHLRHTVLEDTVFEDKFDVFTDDEIEARYLITPSFMERLKNIKTAFFAHTIRCAFYHGFLFIALSTPKDLFSLCSLDKPVDDFKQYNVLCEEIISIIKLIDYFKLDEKIGL